MLCILLTFHMQQMAFPLAWPQIYDSGLDGAPHRTVEGVVEATATALLFPSRMSWSGEWNWEWTDWGQFRLLPHTSIWGCPAETAKEEVRGTCQTGVSISQTLRLLSRLVLPHRKGLSWWWWLKLAGRSPREQGNLLGKRWSAAMKKGEGLPENPSHLKNMTKITLSLKFSAISAPKLLFRKGTKGSLVTYQCPGSLDNSNSTSHTMKLLISL